jgi:hypothetical protein
VLSDGVGAPASLHAAATLPSVATPEGIAAEHVGSGGVSGSHAQTKNAESKTPRYDMRRI